MSDWLKVPAMTCVSNRGSIVLSEQRQNPSRSVYNGLRLQTQVHQQEGKIYATSQEVSVSKSNLRGGATIFKQCGKGCV
jgi:hypothetical protein